MPGVEYVFVLMLENRSFDHMLGFSGITGTDVVTGQSTPINGLTGNESNFVVSGQKPHEYKVTRGAGYRSPMDPPHEFTDVLHQLCGQTAVYPPGGAYPAIDASGFAAAYAAKGGDPAEVMKCYTPAQLPVLNALAREFVLCDNWHASLPGPTWPNRMFVHGATASGLDHSPTVAEIAQWETVAGFSFKNGSIFDRLSGRGVKRCLYAGDDFPLVAALKGIGVADIRHYSQFQSDLAQPTYPYHYVFIEPGYDVLHDYKAGTSQHPLGDVTAGEALIKQTYEAIRQSAIWNRSLLIVTWDEHGGFYDHAIPGPAVPPGDTLPDSPYNNSRFTFQQYGVRVPAVIISPLIPQNIVDHRIYDHSCIPRYLESVFSLNGLTQRDRNATDITTLVRLTTPRETPRTLPSPANSSQPAPDFAAPAPAVPTVTVSRPADTVNAGNLPSVVHSAMQQDLTVSPGDRTAIVDRVGQIQTREEAAQYMAEVQQKVRANPAAAAARG